MGKPKVWRTLEELNADHERLCAEVEQIKAAFKDHAHHIVNRDGTSTPIQPLKQDRGGV